MKRLAFVLICAVAAPVSIASMWRIATSQENPVSVPITIESRRGLGEQWLGGSDNLATTEAFEVSGGGYPYLFYWHTGVGVRCATESCICLSQAWPSDFSVDARCDITDAGTTPNDNDGFGACRKIGSSREFFRISREFFRRDGVARRDGVCETPSADGSRENGYPCNDDADCRTGNLDPGNDDVCDTSTENGLTAWERTWGVFLMGTQNCDWTMER